ncbi:MAG TPA: enoyl-CoA hydratase-related protein [Verrucomicrobiae bacterium]|jgi:enoyl-CoA hydratase/carnithine racemase/NADPH:quinone reductase-like Zn-dependent oxidoreductase|nr:enoyl-CoA hydratase-related protein [Verrucomicrobiae bacterium]
MAEVSRDVDAAWWSPAASSEPRLPLGAPFRPGLDPLPTDQRVWAVVKDRWGRPAHGEPREALREMRAPVPAVGPDEALGYVLHAGLTYNGIFAARGVPISVFDLHDRDLHVAGSGAVVVLAALGSQVAREGRLRVGELRVLYPGVSNLLAPRAGEDPMHAEFKIQGYETPDGSFAQFVRGQAPQWLAHSERLTLAEGSSYMLDLETVYKALYDVARVQPGERVFVEGAAGGTGIYAVAVAALRGARVTGLVSTDDKGRLVLAAGGHAFVNRKAPELAGLFTPVPVTMEDREAWRSRGEAFRQRVTAGQGAAPVDVVVSSVGRDLFARMVDLLGPGGRLVFYGATSGYTLTFVGKPGASAPAEMLRRADLRPGEGVLLYWGTESGRPDDAVAAEAVAATLVTGARVVVAARTDAQAAAAKAAGAHGVASIETLARESGLRWPATMPDYDIDRDAYRAYQDATLKPFGQAVGRLLATPDNPRGNPDLVIERAAQDTLGISTFLARPFTGRVVYVESTEGRRFSFYAPNVWMHEKRVLFPTFAVLGSHLSNAHQADQVVRLLDAGALRVHAPVVRDWSALAECHQLMHENRHSGTFTVRVGAGAALDGAHTARQVYESWGSRYLDGKTVSVRLDPVRPGASDLVALVTVDSPPANAIGRAVLEDLERAVDALEREPGLRAAVLAGSGTMFVAGADIRALRAFAGAADVETFTLRVHRLFLRMARLRAPVIAAVDGYALGGGNELQMACAWRVGAARAEWGQPEINLHVLPGFGGTQSLPRLALRRGRATGRPDTEALLAALVMLLDGRRRGADVALALGLIDELAPADALSHALGVARRVALGEWSGARWSPLAEGAALETRGLPGAVAGMPEIGRLLAHHEAVPRMAAARAIMEAVRVGLEKGVADGLAFEARAFGRAVASDEGHAGIDRFLARQSWPLPLRREGGAP